MKHRAIGQAKRPRPQSKKTFTEFSSDFHGRLITFKGRRTNGRDSHSIPRFPSIRVHACLSGPQAQRATPTGTARLDCARGFHTQEKNFLRESPHYVRDRKWIPMTISWREALAQLFFFIGLLAL